MRVVRATRVVVAAWVLVSSSGCVSVWRVNPTPPRELLKNPEVTAVRITTTDTLAPRIEVYDPHLAGDSITGHPSKLAVARIYVPLSHIKTLSTQHKSLGKTALIGLAIVGAVGAYALLQSLNQGY